MSPITWTVVAEFSATVVEVAVGEGDRVVPGQTLALLEAMKMRHPVEATAAGTVLRVAVRPGELVDAGSVLVSLAAAEGQALAPEATEPADAGLIRPDLAEVFARHAAGLDAHRPEAVAKRRQTGHRTAREHLADLFDGGAYAEYGA